VSERQKIEINIPDSFQELFTPARYKSYRGGRGGAKSYAFADTLISMAATKPLRILCARELQSSIRESVHQLLESRIDKLGVRELFDVQKSTILGTNGSEFIFKGIRFNISEIKSMEGIDICWVEEAQNVSETSWSIITPTIRTGKNLENSEIWLSWNTGVEEDATYQRFVVHPPPDCISKIVNYPDNPFFPEVLRKEMEYCKQVDYQAYLNIWLGQPKKISDAVIFKDKFIVEDFETPKNVHFRFGADWGFAEDPTVLVRFFIIDNELYIDQQAYGFGVEIDDIPTLFDTVEESRRYKIVADSARPETISYVRRKQFNIVACKKQQAGTKEGFVQDGISFMKQFKKIHIHTRCKNIADEFAHYSYKVDDKVLDENGRPKILPIIVDKFNHGIDSIRYGLEDLIFGKTKFSAFLGG